MKASEVIEHLQKLIAQHGDCPIYVRGEDGGCEEAAGIEYLEAPQNTPGALDGWKIFVLTG